MLTSTDALSQVAVASSPMFDLYVFDPMSAAASRDETKEPHGKERGGENGSTGAPQTLRVALISHSYLELGNRQNATALRQLVDLKVVVPRTWTVSMGRRLTYEGSDEDGLVPLRSIELPRSQMLLKSLGSFLLAYHPDVVHVDYPPWSPIVYQTLVAKRGIKQSMRVVSTIKKNTYRDYPSVAGKLKRAVARYGLSHVDGLVVASHAADRMLLRVFGTELPPRIVSAHLGVDVDDFRPAEHPSASPGLHIGYCGRFDADKAVRDLIAAVVQVRARTGADVRLSMLGSGQDWDAISELAAGLSWLSVRPAVAMNKVPEFLRTLNAFILPSRAIRDHEEHDAQALVQAMASGLACIATDVGINPEVVGDAGIIVPSKDVSRMEEAIERLLLDQPFRFLVSQRARDRAVALYSVESVARSRAVFYQQVCGNAT
jgi:glycosyltransferase involved in cell wall biosynthesis